MKEVLFSVCVTAVITAVYKIIAPTDKFSSQIKLLISCFFVLSVINAVKGTGLTGDIFRNSAWTNQKYRLSCPTE